MAQIDEDKEVDSYHKWMTEHTELPVNDREDAWLELKGARTKFGVIPDKYRIYMQIIAAHGKKYALSAEQRRERLKELAGHYRSKLST